MGEKIGVPGLCFLSTKEMMEKEPLARGRRGLFSPSGAVVDPLALLHCLHDEICDRGGEIRLGQRVLEWKDRHVRTSEEVFTPSHVVNCAGMYADRLAHERGIGLDFQVIPFRGEYAEVSSCPVRSMIYQAPDLRFPFLSVHLTRIPNGKVLAGPTALLALGRESYRREFCLEDVRQYLFFSGFYRLLQTPAFVKMAYHSLKLSYSKNAFMKEVQSLVGPIKKSQIKPFRSGIRAQLVNRKGRFENDMKVFFSKNETHILNCVSPGMTSSFAFAQYLDRGIHS
jgi:L-2-hydroxyglutarate oxidase